MTDSDRERDSELRRRVQAVILHHAMVPSGAAVVVGVSGGADSLALLHLLTSLRERLPFTLHVATLDHGLRGAAGAADADFVRRTAEAWGLPVTVGAVQLDPQASGLEARARAARYHFLATTARTIGADRVAVAHHADDQAETVLMHLIRGTGLHGLAGMRPLMPLPGAADLLLIRPLLDISRAELVAYCAAHGLAYRHDATNDLPGSLRNQLRLQTLPHLRELNPRINEALNRLADLAAVDDAYLQQQFITVALPHLQRVTDAAAARLTVPLSIFRDLHPALQYRLLQYGWQQISPLPDEVPGYEHLSAAAQVMQTGGVGAIALLPGKVQVRRDYETVIMEPLDASPSTTAYPYLLPPGSDLPVTIPGRTETPYGWSLETRLTEAASGSPPPGLMVPLPDGSRLYLRTRRPGDRITPRGLAGKSRKLKAWLIDRKIPQAVRDQLPLLVRRRAIESAGKTMEHPGDPDEIVAVLIGNEWYVTDMFDSGYSHSAANNRTSYVTLAGI